MASDPCILSAGCDWITATAIDPKKADFLATIGERYAAQENEAGNEARLFSMAGFDGFRCGQVQVARRGPEVMLRLSGNMAQQNWKAALEYADNCSRVDFQVTARQPGIASKVIANHYRDAMKFLAHGKSKAKVQLFKSSDGSATVYLGRRVSDRFGRIYNKGLESEDLRFHNAVRYEIECKNKVAWSLAHQVAANESEYAAVVGSVRKFLSTRLGSLPNFPSSWTPLSVAPMQVDLSRSLDWLRVGVRPTAMRIVRRGYLDEVLSALGLTDYVNVKESGITNTTESELEYVC